MRALVVLRKTLADFASGKLLLLYLVPYLGLSGLIAMAVTDSFPHDIGSLALSSQARFVSEQFAWIGFVWAIGIPIMVLGAVLAASSLATEAERGTLRILLSKPIRRWEVFVGTAAAIFVYTFLAGLMGLFAVGAGIVLLSGVSAGALGQGFFALLGPTVVYGAIVAVVIAAVGSTLAVLTRNSTRTLLGGLLVPALFFAFIPIRMLAGQTYRSFFLYYVDLNYHFGNAYVYVHELIGPGLSPPAQSTLDTVAGVYESTAAASDPLVGGMPNSLPTVGYVPPVLSVGLLLVGAGLILAVGLRQFDAIDIS